ncbi:ImmA/IrrE family metallo-endopeptidase [Enterococcus sp. AZ029]|uniref:ImmA/IrrE family metallo-endopeptidase n=1 Tax=Enterococcus sp. AZ029 TaxID=2774841 RepID=UPI003F2386EF
MKFNKKKLYFETQAFTDKLINEISINKSKKKELINCYDIETYVKETENIDFFDHSFNNQTKKLIWGAITKIDNVTMVATAQHLKTEIKNFTKMHEIIHHFFDYTTTPNNEKIFETLLLKKGYHPEDYPKEFRANKGAGMLLINKKALEYAFNNYNDLDKMARFFNVNDIVLKIRILDELIYSHNLSYRQANLLYNSYYFQQKKQLKKILFK